MSFMPEKYSETYFTTYWDKAKVKHIIRWVILADRGGYDYKQWIFYREDDGLKIALRTKQDCFDRIETLTRNMDAREKYK